MNTPPKLTDEQIDDIDQGMCGNRECVQPFARAIETARDQQWAEMLAGQEPVATWENTYGMKEWQLHALRAGWWPQPKQEPMALDDQLARSHSKCIFKAPQPQPKREPVEYDHGPQAETLAEAERDVRKWLNERPNRPLDLRHVAMLAYHAQQSVEHEPVAWKHDCATLLQNGIELWIDRCPHCGKPATHEQKPVKDRLDFWTLIDENQRLRAELKFNTVPQPQREWVGLSDSDLADCSTDEYETARYWEAKLREKNS